MSFWEIIVIVLVAVLVIRPERLPEVAYAFGKIIARLQRGYETVLQKIKNPL